MVSRERNPASGSVPEPVPVYASVPDRPPSEYRGIGELNLCCL